MHSYLAPLCLFYFFIFFFFNDTATTEIYTLSLHDALPIYSVRPIAENSFLSVVQNKNPVVGQHSIKIKNRSEEHTSELQSHSDLVCRLLLEKKKKKKKIKTNKR